MGKDDFMKIFNGILLFEECINLFYMYGVKCGWIDLYMFVDIVSM